MAESEKECTDSVEPHVPGGEVGDEAEADQPLENRDGGDCGEDGPERQEAVSAGEAAEVTNGEPELPPLSAEDWRRVEEGLKNDLTAPFTDATVLKAGLPPECFLVPELRKIPYKNEKGELSITYIKSMAVLLAKGDESKHVTVDMRKHMFALIDRARKEGIDLGSADGKGKKEWKRKRTPEMAGAPPSKRSRHSMFGTMGRQGRREEDGMVAHIGNLRLPPRRSPADRRLPLPSYNDARINLGLPPVRSLLDLIPEDAVLRAFVERIYGGIDGVDAYIGGLIEARCPKLFLLDEQPTR